MLEPKKMTIVVGLPIVVLSLFVFVPNFWGTQTFTGRMTGGGSIFLLNGGDDPDLINLSPAPSGTRITHGFELHCGAINDPGTITRPNNLQINIHMPDGTDHRFHLNELTSGACMRSDNFNPAPPKSSQNYWYNGVGTGSYDGMPGYCADWVFTDEGEPGTKDRIMSLRIGVSCNALGGTLSVGSVPGDGEVDDASDGRTLTFGNHQAHSTR